MHKTPAEWALVKAEAVTSGSTAQATNVLQMALEDISVLGQINANLMGDDESVPRYTRKRLRQEVQRHLEVESRIQLAALNKIVNNWGDLHPKDLAQARAAIAAAGDA